MNYNAQSYDSLTSATKLPSLSYIDKFIFLKWGINNEKKRKARQDKTNQK